MVFGKSLWMCWCWEEMCNNCGKFKLLSLPLHGCLQDKGEGRGKGGGTEAEPFWLWDICILWGKVWPFSGIANDNFFEETLPTENLLHSPLQALISPNILHCGSLPDMDDVFQSPSNLFWTRSQRKKKRHNLHVSYDCTAPCFLLLVPWTLKW